MAAAAAAEEKKWSGSPMQDLENTLASFRQMWPVFYSKLPRFLGEPIDEPQEEFGCMVVDDAFHVIFDFETGTFCVSPTQLLLAMNFIWDTLMCCLRRPLGLPWSRDSLVHAVWQRRCCIYTHLPAPVADGLAMWVSLTDLLRQHEIHTLVDIGCGRGFFTAAWIHYLKSRGWSVTIDSPKTKTKTDPLDASSSLPPPTEEAETGEAKEKTKQETKSPKLRIVALDDDDEMQRHDTFLPVYHESIQSKSKSSPPTKEDDAITIESVSAAEAQTEGHAAHVLLLFLWPSYDADSPVNILRQASFRGHHILVAGDRGLESVGNIAFSHLILESKQWNPVATFALRSTCVVDNVLRWCTRATPITSS